MTLEQSQYIEIESSLSDDEDAHITAGEPIPVGSGLLYAQQMLQETLTMTRRGRTERPASARVRVTSKYEVHASGGQAVRDQSGTSPKGLHISAREHLRTPTKCCPFNLATEERCSPRRAHFQQAFSQYQSELSPRMQQTHPQAGHLNSRPKSCDPPTPTKVKPFNLVCVFQHEQHKARMHILRQKEEAEEREQHQFRARPYSPLTVRCRTPRSPSSPRKPPTEPEPFCLESPRRHQEYVQHGFPEKLAREKDQRRQEKLAAKRKEEQKAAEIKSLRKNLVFRARPVPNMQHYWVPNLSNRRPCTDFKPFHLTPTST